MLFVAVRYAIFTGYDRNLTTIITLDGQFKAYNLARLMDTFVDKPNLPKLLSSKVSAGQV